MECPNCGNDCLNLVYRGQDADGYKIRDYVCDECGWDEGDDEGGSG